MNVQSVLHPSRTSYQLTKTSDWRPLFCRRFPNPRSETVQLIDSIHYVDTEAEEVSRLEQSITNHLKQSFMKWRKTRRLLLSFYIGLKLCLTFTMIGPDGIVTVATFSEMFCTNWLEDRRFHRHQT